MNSENRRVETLPQHWESIGRAKPLPSESRELAADLSLLFRWAK